MLVGTSIKQVALPSRKAYASTPGTLAPPEPPDETDQFAVLFQLPVAEATQYRSMRTGIEGGGERAVRGGQNPILQVQGSWFQPLCQG